MLFFVATFANAIKSGTAALSILPWATYATKVSILLLLGRIFVSEKFRKVLWGVFGVLTCFCIASFLAEVAQCIPAGSQLKGNGRCINYDALFSALSWINAVFDTCMLFLPLPMIWRLHTNLRRKIETSAIFGVGLIAVIASFLRAGYSMQSSQKDTSCIFPPISSIRWCHQANAVDRRRRYCGRLVHRRSQHRHRRCLHAQLRSSCAQDVRRRQQCLQPPNIRLPCWSRQLRQVE